MCLYSVFHIVPDIMLQDVMFSLLNLLTCYVGPVLLASIPFLLLKKEHLLYVILCWKYVTFKSYFIRLIIKSPKETLEFWAMC